jgi:hypothetical protein
VPVSRVFSAAIQSLGGALEVLTKAEFAKPERIRRLITGFLNS